MYAIFETGGKQYKVENGSVIFVEKLNVAEGEVVNFDKVLMLDDGKLKVGTPYIDGAAVAAKVLKQGKDKKITVFTYKPKKNEKRKLGHRQPYTKLEITSIGVAEKPEKKTAAADSSTAKKTTTKKTTTASKSTATKSTAAKSTATKSTASKTTSTAKKAPAAKKTTTSTTAKKTTAAKSEKAAE